jgi:hypothetical protein
MEDTVFDPPLIPLDTTFKHTFVTNNQKICKHFISGHVSSDPLLTFVYFFCTLLKKRPPAWCWQTGLELGDPLQKAGCNPLHTQTEQGLGSL